MRHRLLGMAIALGVAISAIVASYVILDSLYGTTQREVYVQSGGKQLEHVVPQTLEEVEQARPPVLIYEDNENAAGGYLADALSWSDASWYRNVKTSSWENVKDFSLTVLNSPNAQMNPLFVADYDVLEGSDYLLSVQSVPTSDEPSGATPYAGGGLEETRWPENEAGASFFVYETKSINVLPIAASIGIAMGVIVFAVWAGYRQVWGEATSTLLEEGLHGMTVKDVEIVGHIMEMKEFTIPQLMKLTNTSKITVWRTVQKLVERGLVQTTKQTRLAANGLGGRGKPSRVYKYVGGTKT
ncbi:MAG: MarR family transcriptional regulator [Hadesarchaea archaeon]|nr:MarR family transcriptional regulator [Hadesarchaea archaeon]